MQRNPHSYQIATGYRTFYSLSLIYQPITKKRLFLNEKVIQEFSLRGKPVYLHVRHRRWYDKATGEPFSYTYDDLAAEGTKLTPEFVSFLKEED